MGLPVSPGDVIDGTYVIEHLLGQGGMGAVFVAREERLGRRVALKVLLSTVADNPDAVVRFEREARSAAALQSDHVTRVLSVGHLASGQAYIVMEFLEGEDLAALLERRGPLPIHEVIGFMTQVCDALSEAHALGIVHRDLKPANIFLARRPNGSTTVKVLDFGISKNTSAGGSRSLTATTALMGTPAYMSPEQLREARGVDGRADLWAIGAMMYELLTGQPPFVSEALAELCALILTTSHAPLMTRRQDAPSALDAIVNRCLEKDPARRFSTARELMAALSTVRVPAPLGFDSTAPVGPGAPAPVAPPQVASQGPAQPLPMATPRMSPMAVLPTHGVVAPAAGNAPVVAPATVDPVSTTQPWLEPRRPSALGLVLVGVAVLIIGGVALLSLLRGKPTLSEHDDKMVAASGATSASSGFATPVPPPAASTPAPLSSATNRALSATAPRATTQAPPASTATSPKLPEPAPLPVMPSAKPVPAVVKPSASPPSNPGSLMPAERR